MASAPPRLVWQSARLPRVRTAASADMLRIHPAINAKQQRPDTEQSARQTEATAALIAASPLW